MANKEEDFLWLINTLRKAATDFETLYGIGFMINDIIILKQGEPKHWLYMDEKRKIKQKDEEWLKFQVIKEYFKNPKIRQEDLNEIENYNDSQYSNLISQNYFQKNKIDKMLFYFYQSARDITVVRPASLSVAEQLMSKPQDYQELLNHWTKIIGYYPINSYKGTVLYQVTYSGRNRKCMIERRNVETKKLDTAEFLKKEGSQKKTFTFETKLFKSLASSVNEKCNLLATSLVRFLETKYHKTIAEMQIEFFMNDSGQIYLSGAEKINFYGADGEIDINLDKNNLEQFQFPQMEEFKCIGQYCDCAGDSTYYEENDEAFSVFIQSQKKKDQVFYVQYKSIILDQIERYKTIQSIKSVQQGVKITEQLIFKVRKYYSFSQISACPLFSHYKFDNIYKRIRVCEYCYAVYNKVDSMRADILSQKNRKQVTDQEIQATIDKMANSQGLIIGGTQLKERKVMSKEFYQKLDIFDSETKFFKENFVVTKSVDPSFFSKKAKAQSTQNFFSLTQKQNEDEEKQFVLPKIVEVTIQEKNSQYIKKKKKFVSRQEAEALGLKHYLGHTKNLPYSDCGLAISKSSLALNQLQDKIRDVENLKNKIENEKIKKVVEEIELIMCPYYGKGKVDTTRFEQFISILKEREQIYGVDVEQSFSKSSKKVQVVTDKNEFLTENQRKQKQDKETKAKEIEESKKNFLEENRDLAASVIKIRNQERLQKAVEKKKKEVQSRKSLQLNNIEFNNKYNQENIINSRKLSTQLNNLKQDFKIVTGKEQKSQKFNNSQSYDSNSVSDDFDDDIEKSQINDNPEQYRPKNFPLFQNND
ncbi:hypothetical protein ABPG74_006023 [Tetrahymena malaccensis]